jgi:hypothetical protein
MLRQKLETGSAPTLVIQVIESLRGVSLGAEQRTEHLDEMFVAHARRQFGGQLVGGVRRPALPGGDDRSGVMGPHQAGAEHAYARAIAPSSNAVETELERRRAELDPN